MALHVSTRINTELFKAIDVYIDETIVLSQHFASRAVSYSIYPKDASSTQPYDLEPAKSHALVINSSKAT